MADTKEKKLNKGEVAFGAEDFDLENDLNASWEEVFQMCCVHSAEEWIMIFVGICTCAVLLYFFLFGLAILGDSAKVMGGCKAGSLFGDDTNPIAGLMVGILATVLLQSSSTTTSIVVSLVPSIVSVEQGIYMIMGANIGTSVTSTIVAMGQMGDSDQLERAFAGATVHDLFNFLTVGTLFPVEIVTKYLARVTKLFVKNADPDKGEKWEGPVKKIVSPLSKKIIIANKSIIKSVSKGGTCESYYPVNCTNPDSPTYGTCDRGLINCNKDTDVCPLFFNPHSDQPSIDKVSGGVCFIISIFILFVCLGLLVLTLQKLLLGVSTRVLYKATDINGYIAILIGAGITLLVQSSSITTSVLTPLVGMDLLRLEAMLPLTLGANIGTTGTAIMGALVSDGPDPLQVALAHLLFNITGIAIWYPFPVMRKIPLEGARMLGRVTRLIRVFPIIYIAVMFFLLPIVFLAISSLFMKKDVGYTTLGIFLVLIIFISVVYFYYYFSYKGGKEQIIDAFVARERRRDAVQSLPDDMEMLKEQVKLLSEHTGCELPTEVAKKENAPEEAAPEDDDDNLSEVQT